MKKGWLILFTSILFLMPFVKAHVVISEVWYDTDINDNHVEFIELYNPHSYDINISGYQIIKEDGNVDATIDETTVGYMFNAEGSTIIPSYGYYLIADDDDIPINSEDEGVWPSYWPIPNCCRKSVNVELELDNSNYGFTLNMGNGTLVDTIGWGSPDEGYYEGTAFNQGLVSDGDSIERKSGITHYDDEGNGMDSNDNSFDFRVLTTPQPQNSTNGTEIFDNILPVIYLNSPDNNTFFSEQNINFTFNFTDNTNNTNCSLYLDNVLNQTNETTLNNTITTFEVLNINENNNIEWKITCIDNSLNENSSLRTFTIDLTSPVISYEAPINANNTYLNSRSIIINVSAIESNGANITFTLFNSTSLVNITTYAYATENLTINWSFAAINNNYNEIYYYNVTVTDKLNNQNNTETRLITLDNTFPIPAFTTGTLDDGLNRYNNFIFVNVSVTEINEANISFDLYNDTGLVNSTDYTSNVRTINWTNLPDQNYKYNVTITDKANNVNSTQTRTITLDNTFPLIEYGKGTEENSSTFDRTWIYVNITFTELNLANITFSLFNSNSLINETIFTDSTSSINWTGLGEETYSYNITVRDLANNINSTVTREITLASATSDTTTTTDGGGGGGGGSTGNTFSIDITSKSELVVKERDVIDFNLKGNSHEIKIDKVKANSVVLTISSDPITIEIKINETKEIDVDEDDKADIKITLLGILSGRKVEIIFEEIKEEIIETISEEETKEEERFLGLNETITEPSEPDLITGFAIIRYQLKNVNQIGVSITIAIILLGLIIYYFIFRRKSI